MATSHQMTFKHGLGDPPFVNRNHQIELIELAIVWTIRFMDLTSPFSSLLPSSSLIIIRATGDPLLKTLTIMQDDQILRRAAVLAWGILCWEDLMKIAVELSSEMWVWANHTTF